jgi:hypothetical protein
LSLRVVVVLMVALLALAGAQADTVTDGSTRVIFVRDREAVVDTPSASQAVLTRTEPASCVEPIGASKSAFSPTCRNTSSN